MSRQLVPDYQSPAWLAVSGGNESQENNFVVSDAQLFSSKMHFWAIARIQGTLELAPRTLATSEETRPVKTVWPDHRIIRRLATAMSRLARLRVRERLPDHGILESYCPLRFFRKFMCLLFKLNDAPL